MVSRSRLWIEIASLGVACLVLGLVIGRYWLPESHPACDQGVSSVGPVTILRDVPIYGNMGRVLRGQKLVRHSRPLVVGSTTPRSTPCLRGGRP